MRPDVKLGMVVSLVVVFVAGGYYIYRDAQEKPIPLSGGNVVTPTPQAQQNPPIARPGPEASKTVAPQEQDRAARLAERQAKNRTGNSPQKTKGDVDSQRRRRIAGDKRRNPRGKVAPATSTQVTSAEQPPVRGTQPADGRQEQTSDIKATPQVAAGDTPAAEKKSDNVEQLTARSSQQSTTRSAQRKTAGPEIPAAPKIKEPETADTRRQGVARATAPKAADKPQVAMDIHRVQSGDTFASLALSYYGSEKHTQFLIDSNPHVRDPRRLTIDTKINIPPLPAASDRGAAKSPAGAVPGPDKKLAGRRTYKVQPGDSFYAIARNVLGDASRWEDLFAMNKDLVQGDPKKLRVGQVIALPTS